MTYTTLISTTDLAQRLTDPNWAIFDCRFSLADPERGRRDYVQVHIPGAIYAHLNEDLSGPIIPGVTGRHPLPAIDELAARFSAWGIDERIQVVAYDDSGGGMAARLWWLLRWLGHEAVAVLDGDWRKWQREGRPVQDGIAIRATRRFAPHTRSDLLISTEEIETSLRGAHFAWKQSLQGKATASHTALAVTPTFKLFDSRTADRFRGENETIDPIAGHIPGAISAPYPDNLNPDGTFRSDEELRARFIALLGDTPAERTAFYCGSGVTTAQNILAVKHVGLGDAKLYAGSWSEWITNPKRPIEK
jgi:thiosulfate/3-mercaptopyruvate sulfurtransferase